MDIFLIQIEKFEAFDRLRSIPSQSGPTFGSGQLQAPLLQMAFPGQLLLFVQITELEQDRVILLKGSPFGHVHWNVPGAFLH